eukprot:5424169-Amphidinium_carterae.2
MFGISYISIDLFSMFLQTLKVRATIAGNYTQHAQNNMQTNLPPSTASEKRTQHSKDPVVETEEAQVWVTMTAKVSRSCHLGSGLCQHHS